MKKYFKKVSAILSTGVIMVSSIALATAASYPAPFVVGGSANVAVVYGANSLATDSAQAGSIISNLEGLLPSTGGSSTVTGGDSILLAKSSDKLNINDTLNGVFTGTITSDNLKTVLAKGTYIASDNDEFDYEQKITIGGPELKHFRDSDYESLIGLSERTPTIGFKITSNTPMMNYTLEFLEDVESDVVSSRWDDVEGSDIPLMGRTYYVSELQNGSTAAQFGKLVLLDAASVGNVKEGETTTVNGKEVSIDWIDADEVVYMVDGVRAPASGKLLKGNSYKLSDGSYIGVRDISKLAVSGEIGSSSFSIGTGKIEFPSLGADIKMNDNTINGVKGYVQMNTAGTKLDKIVIEWKTDEEVFLTPETELTMPGFEALKFTMNDLVRNTEEKVTVEKDSDTTIRLSMPIKGGDITVNLLYTNASGEFIGVGKAATERFATTNSSSLFFYEKESGNDFHDYFVATYNISKEGESYLLRAQVTQDTSAARNETTIQSYENGAWATVCDEKAAGDTCDIGDVSLTINAINYTSGGNESVKLTAGSGVNFHSIVTPGGLYVYLPYVGGYWNTADIVGNTSVEPGAMNLTASVPNLGTAGHSYDSFYLFMVGEDKDETLGSGTAFNLTIDDTTNNKLQVSQVNGAGSGGGSTYGAEEVGDSSNIYEIYVKDDVAPRILHYTKPDEDYAEIYYPSGESQTYAEVYIAESGATLTSTGDTGSLGEYMITDAEISSMQTKNLILIGGSCVNSATATVLGVSYPTCGVAFTTATGVGSGQFLIKGVADAYTTGKIALVVAGYDAADTANAATYLRTQTVDTSKEYKGTSSTSAELVTTVAA